MRCGEAIVGVGPVVILVYLVRFATEDRAFRLKLEQGWKIKIRAAAGKKIEGTERQCFKSEGSVPGQQR